MINRRKHLGNMGGSAVWSWLHSSVANAEDDLIVEQQRGDPGLKPETLRIYRFMASQAAYSKATFEARKPAFGAALIKTAQTFIGSTRTTTPDRVTDFLALYDLPLKNESGYVPFCAAGVAYCAAMAYSDLLGKSYKANPLRTFKEILPDIDHWYYYPSPSCNDMYLVAAGKRRWVQSSGLKKVIPKPGWIVLFAWDKPGSANHCGIITGGDAKTLRTIEFNTSGTVNGNQINGGAVVARERPNNSQIMGFIRVE
jgi:hypothetical protein